VIDVDLAHLEFKDVSLRRVSDGEYFGAALELLRASKYRCHVSMFLVDYHLEIDPVSRVDNLAIELAAAQWRGVDVKLLLGGSQTNQRLREAVLGSMARVASLGLSVRLASATGENSHVKLVVADDQALTGSHNWTRGMFGAETQDSVLFEHRTLAAALDAYFEGQWAAAESEDPRVSL
jgi:PLD-like domain